MRSWARMGLMVLAGALFLSGCRTVTPSQGTGESAEDVHEALSAVAGAISGKTMDEKDLRDLERQIRTDQEAQTAIQAISDSVGGRGVIKYCPVTGKRYAPHMEFCPEHNVRLEIVDP